MQALKHCMRFVAQRSLVLFGLAATLAFHFINWRHGEALAPLRTWVSHIQPTRIVLGPKGHEHLSFRFVAVSDAPLVEAGADEPAAKSKKARHRRRRAKAAGKQLETATEAGTEPASSKQATPAPSHERLEGAKHPARPHLETASQWLTWAGLHLRAQVNQSPPRWLNFHLRKKRSYFLRDELEFQYVRHAPIVHRSFFEVTKLMARTMRKAGATLVIAPMPTKVSIYRDRLPAWLPDQELWSPIPPRDEVEDSYRVYSAARNGARAESIDVFKAFSRYHRAHPKADIYVPSSHQWSSLGISLTVVEVIKNLRRRGWDLGEPELIKLNHAGLEYDRPLLDLLNLPPAFAPLYPQTERREVVYGVSDVATEDSSRRLIVFGTCFSNRARDAYGFSETLAHALRRRTVYNLSAEGGKTLPSFVNFLKRVKRVKRGDLVVWEFNVRETFTRAEVRKIRHYLKRIAQRSRPR